MDSILFDLYKELLAVTCRNGKTIFENLGKDKLCLAGHHAGNKYEKTGLMIYGQAMNGWENDSNLSRDDLAAAVLANAIDYREFYPIVNPGGWHGIIDGEEKSYYYKHSLFWKLNYQVITGSKEKNFDHFYVWKKGITDDDELYGDAWPQNVVWSNLFKVSYEAGGNPDDYLIEKIREISLQIVLREIEIYKPGRVLFNTGENLFTRVAMNENNVFGLEKASGDGNVLYTGRYEYLPGKECKMLVCRRPDAWNTHYTNAKIIEEAKEILDAFEKI